MRHLILVWIANFEVEGNAFGGLEKLEMAGPMAFEIFLRQERYQSGHRGLVSVIARG